MRVTDIFEIKEEHNTGHAPGLVVVLDVLLAGEAERLIGRLATIRTPSGKVLQLLVDEAKEHRSVSSLFFKNLFREDIAVDSEITLDQELNQEDRVTAILFNS